MNHFCQDVGASFAEIQPPVLVEHIPAVVPGCMLGLLGLRAQSDYRSVNKSEDLPLPTHALVSVLNLHMY